MLMVIQEGDLHVDIYIDIDQSKNSYGWFIHGTNMQADANSLCPFPKLASGCNDWDSAPC